MVRAIVKFTSQRCVEVDDLVDEEDGGEKKHCVSEHWIREYAKGSPPKSEPVDELWLWEFDVISTCNVVIPKQQKVVTWVKLNK